MKELLLIWYLHNTTYMVDGVTQKVKEKKNPHLVIQSPNHGNTAATITNNGSTTKTTPVSIVFGNVT